MNISFGIITKDLLDTISIDKFLDNSKEYGHDVYSVIVTYSRHIDYEVVERLRKKVNLEIIKINDHDIMCDQLADMRMSNKSIKNLINCSRVEENGIVPYGTNRNSVIMKGILTGVDVLVFVDTDVFPSLLVEDGGIVKSIKVDFLGRHLEYLKKDDVYITTSDYSGYYIIPPMNFDGMEELFRGIQKNTSYDFIKDSSIHNCFVGDNYHNRKVFETNKILGGNVAIKLKIFRKIIPFFSSSYMVNGERFLTRGEDTLMGIEINRLKTHKCIDIDTKIFHNTYSNYPQIPDILNDKNIQDRFFYACMGWIGRNPFLNWINGEDVSLKRIKQANALKIGSKEIARYLNDDRFLILEEAIEISYDRLDIVIKEYRDLTISWKEFIVKHDKWRGNI
ncbi:MAG: hypothetical protein WBA54_05630 [Acidaminobacteraceae bacterium]